MGKGTYFHRRALHTKLILYKSYLASQRFRSILDSHAVHTLELFYARPAVLIGISGFAGGTLSFYLPFGTAIAVFVLSHAFLFFARAILTPSEDRLQIRIILLIPALILGLYCMAVISLQRRQADDVLISARADDGSSYGTYEGYIVSVSVPDGQYNTYTFIGDKGVKICFESGKSDLPYGRHVRISGYLTAVPASRNPGGFDRSSYLARQGVFLCLNTYDNCIKTDSGSSIAPDLFVRLEMMGLRLRGRIGVIWGKVLSTDDASLLSGMILGDTSGMSSNLKTAFRMCSLSHLTAVSGANVAYFLVPVTAVIRKCSGRRGVRYAMAFIFLIFFGFLTGWTSSVTRALFMSMGTIVSSMMMKRHDTVSAMFLTAGILHFINPFAAVDYGFLLSFSAALSLVLFSDSMSQTLQVLPIGRNASQAVGCLVCARLGMLPWLAALSGKESVLLFAVNLAGTFLSEGISMLCLPLSAFLLAADIFPFLLPVAKVMFYPLAGLLFLLTKMALICSDQSVQALRLYSVQPLLLFAFGSFIASFLIPRSFLASFLRKILCLFLAAGIVMQICSCVSRPEGTVIFADVGQGDSALILLPGNKSILIDGGGSGSGDGVLIPMLNYYGIEEPDITILTHLHQDHGGGIIELIREGRVSDVYTPCTVPNSELSELFSLKEDGSADLHSIAKGDKIVLSPSAVIYVLSPESIIDGGGNEDSAVVLLVIGHTGILFMGDAGSLTEEKILSDEDTMALLKRDADFLKVGHHGSKYAATKDYLAGLSLQAAVISVGENSYGHPTEETLGRLASENIDIYRTDCAGAVILQLYQNSTQIYEYAG